LESAALATERVERKLAAILAADVAGYSRLMGADEEGTLARLKAHRRELIDPKIAEHRGCIVKTTGDGLLVEFGSVVDALRCATERRLQEALACLQSAHEERPTGPLILAYLVSTYAHLGRSNEARAAIPQLMAVGPFTITTWRRRFDLFKNAADREFVCEGLRRAGVPEG